MQPRETAGITTRLIIEEMRRWGGDEAVVRLLELAGRADHLDVLSDERSWSSYETKIALFEAAAELTGDPHIAREMGTALLRSRIGRALLPMLTLLGSPSQLLASIGRAAAKFSTVADMRLLARGRRSATVSYRLHDGYRPSRYDCDLNIGLLSHVPAIYGLPPATITHSQCQVDGAGECVYELSWRRRRRWRRTPPPAADVVEVQDRFQALQQTVADLVAATDLDTVLPAIARRASGAVQAERFLVVVQVDGEPSPQVYSEGFSPQEAFQIGLELLAGRDLPPAIGSVLCAELRSGRRRHGVLAAFLDGRYDFLDSEQRLLESYARLGASALDSATAVRDAREGRRTAEVLLGFARQLLTTEGTAAVTRLTAEAAQSIGGCDRATVWLWDEDAGALTLAGHAGWPEDEVRAMQALVVRPNDTPELANMLDDPTQPRLYDASSAGHNLRHMIEGYGCAAIAVVPMATPTDMHGVVIAAWMRGGTPPPLHAPPFSRLAGIADQATTALQRAALLDQVQWQASKDELTGLTNRRYFGLLLRETLQRVTATDTAGLLFLDLDRFKHVNDTLGHSAGDLLLQAVAGRLQRCVRTDDVVARLGGDEFTVLLPAGRGSEELAAVADKILTSFTEPIDIAGQQVLVRPSIGGVVVTAGRDPTELLREADIAMYTAKRAGGARMVVYDEAYSSGISQLALEAELHHAIVGGQLSVVYQAQVDLWSGAAVGAEALVRWDHPTHGTLAPADFLPLAEESGLIVPLDLQVLRRAVHDATAWHRAGRTLRVAVNVAARTLADEQLLPTVVGVLAETGLPPDALELELTESSAFADPRRVASAISGLRAHGVSLALDDLGVGHNALRRLQQLPVQRLKIDRSFVADLPSGGAGAHLADAVIRLGERLGVAVIAEGIETREEADALRTAGCREGQGFLYGAPVRADGLVLDRRIETIA